MMESASTALAATPDIMKDLLSPLAVLMLMCNLSAGDALNEGLIPFLAWIWFIPGGVSAYAVAQALTGEWTMAAALGTSLHAFGIWVFCGGFVYVFIFGLVGAATARASVVQRRSNHS